MYVCMCVVALPALGAQYPAVFSAAPATKLMEEGKMHPVEHIINPLALQHDPTAASATAAVIPAVSTPPPFQVDLTYTCCCNHADVRKIRHKATHNHKIFI